MEEELMAKNDSIMKNSHVENNIIEDNMTEKEFIRDIMASYKAIIKSGDPFQNLYNKLQERENKKNGKRFIQALKVECEKTIKLTEIWNYVLLFFSIVISLISTASNMAMTARDMDIISFVLLIILFILVIILFILVGWQIIHILNEIREKTFIVRVIEIYEQDRKK